MFDCVLADAQRPQRLAVSPASATSRSATPATATTRAALDATCPCTTCTNFSRGYLHHLQKRERDPRRPAQYPANLHYYQTLMRELRGAIAEGGLGDYLVAFRKARGELGKTG